MKARKIVALVLAALMASAMFAGCNNNQSEIDEPVDLVTPDYMNETGFPIAKEQITITAMGLKDPGATEWNELEIFQRAEELTNIHFEFELAESTSYTEKKNLSLVGGTYPDMFFRLVEKTDEETYGPAGTFIDLTDLIANYAPNLTKRMEEKPEIKAAVTSMDGNIYSVPYYFETATTNPHLAFVSQEWLDNCGITELPSTVEEFYNMLVAFKTMDANGNGDLNDEIPWSCSGYTAFDWFILPAFTGNVTGMTVDVLNDEVVYTPAMDEYKDYVTFLNRLYTEGLIDSEFITHTYQQFLSKVKSGVVGVYNASPTNLDASTTALQVSLKPLTSDANSTPVVKPVDGLYSGRGVITDKCTYPEAAMRWLDIWYATEEDAVEGLYGNSLFLGIEGEHWEYADADKTTYRFIDPITSFQDINATVSVNMELPSYLSFMAYPTGNPLMEMKVKGVMENQLPYTKSEMYPVNARYSEAESETADLIELDLYNYVTEMTTKFMTGEESLDNFEAYVETLYSMRLEEFVKIKADAYARYKQAVNG